MKLRTLILILAFLPLLWNCGGKEEVEELPAPEIVDDGGDSGDDSGSEGDGEDTGGTTPSGAWEADRGKVVTPSGSGWSSSTVRDGIVFYEYAGTDDISGVKQHVTVVDLDLTNEKYAVRFTYSTPSLVTSTVHKNYNAIATMNAGYEAGSIYIRVAGKDKSALPNTHIGDTGVRNWKSEAAVYSDGERGVHIGAVEKLIRPYVSPEEGQMATYIANQRNYYFNSTESYILSSSPMLINDYEPVGETFINYSISNWTKLNTEEPQYHQRKRHPRSAVALTENNHFLMIAVDGRQTKGQGMSAKELTQFLVKNFNPQYALNMDGGGSTAMCVEGLGDATTHVVNVPIQDNVPGRERARDTHFIIVAK